MTKISVIPVFRIVCGAIGLVSFYLITLAYMIRFEERSMKAKSMKDVYQFAVPQHSVFSFDKDQAEHILRTRGRQHFFRPITAYLEAPLNDTIPNTGDRGDLQNDKDIGTPPKQYVPLPLRTSAPESLRRVEYHRVQTCHDLPGKLPVDRGIQFDPLELSKQVRWNIGGDATPKDFAEQELPYCPVEADPWLPWIHDVFPSQDGSRIEFVAQNKRKCRTGRHHSKDLHRLVPQAALMQPVSVERIDEGKARSLAPGLWYPTGGVDDPPTYTAPRYRLAPYNQSTHDGMFTRFICRFHVTRTSDSDLTPHPVVLGETLSQYPFNYEFIAYRKQLSRLFTAKGRDTMLFWTTTIRFFCPVPDIPGLQKHIALGTTVLSDGSPTVRIDLIPIRTSPRYHDEYYLTEDQIGPRSTWTHQAFDPDTHWGPRQVIPRVEASGRWANIPICLPPEIKDADGSSKLLPNVMSQSNKPHTLAACLWASSEFLTRGATTRNDAQTDTQLRLKEWLEFHRLVGFDHVYLFDNSGAHTNETSLASVAAQYPDFVTRIDWPFIPCNNNPPAHDSCGERSSQYAAENACLTRYAPFTKWLVSFDTDEYLVPMAKDSLKDVLADAEKEGTKILSFYSSRGFLRRDKSERLGPGFQKLSNATFLEAYNCDSGGMPKPRWAARAKKQIYMVDYVPYHFVHFSPITAGMLQTYADAGGSWSRRAGLDTYPVERRVREHDEATMVHAKLVKWRDTQDYEKNCVQENFVENPKRRCWLAYPWPDGKRSSQGNCYINDRVEAYWVPRLRRALNL